MCQNEEGEPPISLHFSFRSPPNRAAVHDLLRPDVTRYVCYSHYRLRRFSTKSRLLGNVQLLAGILTVKLSANTASTGASWSNPVQLSNSDVLEQTDHDYVPPTSPNPGAGGQEVWTFKAIGKGTCSIYTEYKRVFDTIPTWTFALAVTVM